MKRHVGLDVLRAVAVLLVLGRHLPSAGATHPLLETWQRGGWVGVDLFFVLSGFLVSGLLFREHRRYGSIRVGRFLARRGLKIYPAFYAFLAVTIAWCGWLGVPLTWRNVLAQVFFVQNYGVDPAHPGPAFWGHTWTLAIEEQFYLLLAAGLVLLVRRRPTNPFRAIPWVCLGVSVFCLVLRFATEALLPYAHATHVFPTHLRIDALLLGVLLSYAVHEWPERVTAASRCWAPLLLPLGVLLLGLPFVFDLETTAWMRTIGFNATAVGAALLVAVAVSHDWPDTPPIRLLATIGVDSYSIYLWHLFVPQLAILGGLVLTGEMLDPSVLLIVYLVGSVLLGIVAARIVEGPVLRLRDRVWPSRVGGMPSVAAMPCAPTAGPSGLSPF
jgi:peptidoglycan/LPS O-acetylase OafA/YrhL